ncbi:unnamed protein product [Cuscuta epithymum]|uniref:Uncharacterized protein n=1 Tax=Cuscuta epithymum TaxID=186058 RepID=A0AAV0EVK8_9ASTE|nr:unnamed protein product [Cuscuta epithymum]
MTDCAGGRTEGRVGVQVKTGGFQALNSVVRGGGIHGCEMTGSIEEEESPEAAKEEDGISVGEEESGVVSEVMAESTIGAEDAAAENIGEEDIAAERREKN